MALRRAFNLGILLCTVFLCTACAEVKPWQKGYLARSHMTFEPDPLESKFRQHVFQSKEGSFGGYGAGGGGCGCN